MKGRAKIFDWARIRAELETQPRQSSGTALERDPKLVQALLRERTLELAAPTGENAAARLTSVIVLMAGGERYALALPFAQEVVTMSHLAVLPGAAPALLGVANWRGEFVSVFGLAALLGAAKPEGSAARRYVVLRSGEPRLALAVDAVDHVVKIDMHRLQQAEELGARRADLIVGATADSLVLLNGEGLLGSLKEELAA